MKRTTTALPPSPPNLRSAAKAVVEPLAFWGAVLLPFGYGLVLYGGLEPQQVWLLLGLIALNVGCLIAGREYAR
ncbi:MAG: hypothetical protein ACI8XM_001088 [Haloarculaceae archaeon]|jgi:hypothetical protein